MAGYTHQYIQPGDIRFHYLEWGDPAAPPVLLLHGTSSNAHSWDMFAPVLAKNFHVLALDCRDHGDSGDSPVPLNGDLLVEDLKAIVDALGYDTFSLIGLSMGGRTVMNFTGQNPNRVTRLVIEDIGPEVSPEAGARVRQRTGGMPAIFDSIDDLVTYNRQSKINASDQWMRYMAELSTRPTLDGKRELKYRPKQPTANQAPASAAAALGWQTIKNIKCPTLIVRGEESDILSEEIANRMLAAIPGSTTVAITKAGHAVHEDNPEDYNRAVAAFFGITV